MNDSERPTKNDTGELETLHPDLILRRQLEKGEITQAEIDRVWKATSDLSPQTPITVRRAVLLMREVTKGKEPMEAMALNWPFFTQEVMRTCTEMQAALMRDESTFKHLVAGAETIVKELQKVETLNRRFDEIHHALNEIEGRLRRRTRPSSLIRWQRRRRDDGKVVMKDISPLEPELTPDPDHAANEARRFSIGSAWAKEGDKGPLYEWRCPYFVDCQYIYYSGVTDAHVTSQFRCPIHNLTLTRWLP